jgi:hypothetical protein
MKTGTTNGMASGGLRAMRRRSRRHELLVAVLASVGTTLLASGCGLGRGSPSNEADSLGTTALALGSTNQTAPITAKWTQRNTDGSVGAATSVVTDLPLSLVGQYQTFANGAIVSSDDHGAVFMPLNIFNAWLATQSVDAGEKKLIEVLGLPITDVGMFKGAPAVTFEFAQIVDNAGPKLVRGAIYGRYVRLKNTFGAIDLGLPIGQEGDSGDGGRFQQFQNGEILWKQDPLPPDADPTLVPITPAWEMVPGDIYNAWMAPGRGLAPEGYPRGAPYVFKDGMGVVVGAFQRFENKALFFSPATGVARVNISANVLELYNQMGGPLGFPGSPNPPLGFPVGEEQVTAAGTHFLQFQNGMMVTPSLQAVFPKTPTPRVFTNPKYFIDRVSSSGDDCDDPFGCGSLDPYWKLTANIIAPSPRLLFDVQYGNGSAWQVDVNEVHGAFPPFTPDLVIRTTLSGTDDDFSSADDLFGPTNIDWNIDNLWGEIGGPLYRIPANNAPDELLNFEFLVQNNLPYNPKQLLSSQWWSFSNFQSGDLDYATFAETFSNVGPEGSWKDPFNGIFFDLFYKPIANGGNCFGMSLEAIDAREKRSPYAEPIYYYWPPPTGAPLNAAADPPGVFSWYNLGHAINVKQGSQLGNEVVDYFLGDFLMGRQHNPGYQFGEGFHYQLHGVPTLVSMTTSYLFENSHTVLATDYERDLPCQPSGWWSAPGDLCSRIHILNPNLPLLLVGGDPSHDEFIEVNTTQGIFSYVDNSQSPPLHYFGRNDGNLRGLNGRMYVIPYTLLVDKQHTPFTKWAELLSFRQILLVAASGSVAQASDPSGRVMWQQTDEPGRPKWDDLPYLDPAQQIPLAPFPLIASNGAPGTQMYVSGNVAGQTHSYEFTLAPGRAEGTPYDVVIEHALQSSSFTIPGTSNQRDMVTTADIGKATKTTELSIPSDGVPKAVKWTFSGAEKQRWVELSNLGMSPAQRIRMRSEAAGHRVMVNNVAGPDTSAHLRIKAGPGAQPVDIGVIALPHGETTIDGETIVRPCNLTDPFVSLTSVFPSNVYANGLTLSADGLSAYVSVGPTTVSGDIYVATRQSTSSAFTLGSSPLANVNSPADERGPWLSKDGLRLYFSTTNTAGGQADLVVSTRSSPTTAFGAPQPLSNVNYATGLDVQPSFGPEHQLLYFSSQRPSGHDIYYSSLSNGVFAPAQVLTSISSSSEDTHPVASRDGLRLYFRSKRLGPDADSDGSVYMAERGSTDASFATPSFLSVLNTSGNEFPVALSPDECSLFIGSNRHTGMGGVDAFRLYEVKRGTPPSQVTMTLTVTGNGSGSVGAPFNCSMGQTCSVTQPYGTQLTVWASRSTHWIGGCAANGSPGLSTDGVVNFTIEPTCTVQFPP